jgi:heat shock protein HtpX
VTLQQQIRANRFRTALVLVAFALLIAAIAGAVYTLSDIGVGALVLVVGAVYGVYAYISSGKMVAKLTGAHPVTREEWPEVYHVIDTVSIAAGMEAAPPLYVVDDPAPNAFAAGRTPATSYVVVTRGLLETMSKRELEGVLAHEVSHIRNRDVRLMTLAAVLVGVVALVSDLLARMLFFGGGRRKGGGNQGWIFLVLAIVTIILAPLAAVMIQMSLSRRREYLADASAAEITNDPEGLALALRRLELDQRELQHVNQATAHLYIETPLRNTSGPARFVSGLFNTHPPLAARIGVLEEAGGFRLPATLPTKGDLEAAGA